MNETCPYFKSGKCEYSKGAYECNYELPDFHNCKVYKAMRVSLAGGSILDQLKAADALPPKANVAGGSRILGDEKLAQILGETESVKSSTPPKETYLCRPLEDQLGNIYGLWIKYERDAKDNDFIIASLLAHGVSPDFVEKGYTTEENTKDTQGGYLVKLRFWERKKVDYSAYSRTRVATHKLKGDGDFQKFTQVHSKIKSKPFSENQSEEFTKLLLLITGFFSIIFFLYCLFTHSGIWLWVSMLIVLLHILPFVTSKEKDTSSRIKDWQPQEGRDTRQLLADLIQEDELKRSTALGQLGDLDFNTVSHILDRVIKSPEAWQIRSKVIKEITKRPHPMFMKSIILSLKDPDSEVVKAAVNFISKIPHKDAVIPLIDICKIIDFDSETRTMAIKTLGDIGDTGAIKFLSGLSINEQNPKIITAATAALEKLKSK
jgi:hypothetical protein